MLTREGREEREYLHNETSDIGDNNQAQNGSNSNDDPLEELLFVGEKVFVLFVFILVLILVLVFVLIFDFNFFLTVIADVTLVANAFRRMFNTFVFDLSAFAVFALESSADVGL